MPSFLAGKLRGAFGLPAFFLAGNGIAIVAFEKEVSLKAFKLKKAYLAKRLFDSTEVVNLSQIIYNIYKWEGKVQTNTQLSFWWKARSSS